MADTGRQSGALPAEGGTGARDSLLIALTFASGAVDAISFIALGKVFTAFMTGNLVFLGLRAASAPGPGVLTVALSLVAFAVGVFASTRIVKASRGSSVWPREVTVALVVVVIAQSAFAAGWIAVSGHPGSMIHPLVAISALAMGLQSGAVLSLDVKGVFTTAATATLMFLSRELAQDSSAGERLRHGGVLVALLAGATAGGVLLEHARTFAPLLPLAVTILVVAIAYDPLRARELRSEQEAAGELDSAWQFERPANGVAHRRPVTTSARRRRTA